jgi:hypothetical protein
MRAASLLGAATAAVALCACSGSDAAKTDSAKVAQAGAAVPASRGSFDPAAHVLTVYAKDFSYEMPDSITAGWTTIHLVNDGTQLHHVQLVRLDSGKTSADLAAAFKNPGPPPAWAVFVGGANAPDPKSESNATMKLDAGNYVVLCLVDLGDHVPHFAKGMIHPLTITASTTPGTEPVSDASIALSDYTFTLAHPLTAGKHIVKVTNAGPQAHEVELVRFADGKSMKDLGAWMQKMDGPPPATAIGGIPAIVPGSAGYVSLDLAPGNYALICFVPDTKDGKAHLEHGMVKEFKVN